MKKKEKKKTYHEILKKEIRKRTPLYLIGEFFHTICSMLNLISALIIGNILDLLLMEASKEEIFKQVILLMILGIGSLIPRMLYRTFYFSNARAADTRLRKKTIEHLQYVKPEYYEKEEKGDFLSYLSYEVLFFPIKSFGNLYFYFNDVVIAPILMIIILSESINPIIAISLVPLFIIAIIYIIKQYNTLYRNLENSRQAQRELSKIIEQNTSGFQLIKLYNRQNSQKEKFETINDEVKQTDYDIGVIKNKITNGVNTLYACVHISALIIGLVFMYKGMMTVGEIIAFIGCLEYVLGAVVTALPKFIVSVGYYKQARNRYHYFFNLEKYSKNGKEIKQIEKIELNNLTFSYDGKVNVLKDINMTIKKGEKIGIIGQLGSGKTTLMHILAGFYEIPDGMYKINDIEKNEIKPENIFSFIGYAMQKNIVLNTDIEENVAMNQEITQEKMEKAIKRSRFSKRLKRNESRCKDPFKRRWKTFIRRTKTAY